MKLAELEAKYPDFLENAYIAVYPGWIALLDEMLARLKETIPADLHPFFRLRAAEEKYGMFRFVCDNGGDFDCTEDRATEIAWDLFSEYEQRSSRTCGMCGAPGSIPKGCAVPLCELDVAREKRAKAGDARYALRW